jgi:hypothetical protein
MSRPCHSSWLDHPINIWWELQTINLLSMQSSPLPCYLVPRRSNCLPSTIFPDNFSPCYSLVVRNQVSHPCKTVGRITVLYTLIFIFLDSKLEDRRFCTEW